MTINLKLYITILITIFSPYTLAWNYYGHQLISEIAYNELSKQQQQELDKLLDTIISKLPAEDKKLYKKQVYNLTKLSKLSILPDKWKSLKFTNLIEILGISDQELSSNIGNQKSYDWHYKSKITKPKNNNLSKTAGKLNKIFPQLLNNTINTKDQAAKALGIIFISHLLQDAHQPLHAASKTDKGGNGFCLKTKINNQCSYSLHRYWDAAGNLLKYKTNIKNLANDITKNYSKKMFSDQYNNLDPNQWLAESFAYWPIVYHTNKNKFPTKNYQAKAIEISKQRLALAGYRLSELLKNIINNSNKNQSAR